MEKKLGIRETSSQARVAYNPAVFTHFMKKLRAPGIPVIAGIVLLELMGMSRIFRQATVWESGAYKTPDRRHAFRRTLQTEPPPGRPLCLSSHWYPRPLQIGTLTR